MSEAGLPRCFGVFGDPIAHSRSPAMHQAAFTELGLGHRYLPFHVRGPALPEAIRGAAALGFGGVNLTVPHKRAALAVCDRLEERASRIGAVNTLVFVGPRDGQAPAKVEIVGHNTDGPGFLDALAELDGPGVSAAPDHATVLGAGGASLAIVDALLHAFPKLELTWVSRDPARIRAAARVRPCPWSELGPLRGDLLVNTTIVGLAGGPTQFPIPLELGALAPDARVIDIVYPPPAGGLLERAAAAGHRVQDGLPMLLWQGVRALELWLGQPLPDPARAAMRAALHR